MKTSLSSLTTTIITIFLLFVSSSNCTRPTPPPPLSSQTSSTLHNHYCDSFPNAKARSLCIGLQRMHQNSLLLPQPQVDPRFGAEKRRVPTGPNPLHN
ncbi:CLAVATA3/ESR (CLE)-related protein 9 [Glycine soja]|nr:CLAVATA3/ESR (CLE)-related protein 9 [Glycine soja]